MKFQDIKKDFVFYAIIHFRDVKLTAVNQYWINERTSCWKCFEGGKEDFSELVHLHTPIFSTRLDALEEIQTLLADEIDCVKRSIEYEIEKPTTNFKRKYLFGW